MLPGNPHLQLVLPRAIRARERLYAGIWSKLADARVSFSTASEEYRSYSEGRRLDFHLIQLPFPWGKLFDQGWFRVELPELDLQDDRYFRWQDQGEGTAYLDGVPYAGFDVAHRYARLPRGVRELYIEGLCLQSAIWHPEAAGLDPRGSLLSEAAVYSRDQACWDVYHDLSALLELAMVESESWSVDRRAEVHGSGYSKPIDIAPVTFRRLLRSLDHCIDALDTGGLEAAGKALKEAYERLSEGVGPLEAVLSGHAHIDLVWLWPERVGEYKAVHTFATANRLMEEYPELVFGYSQPMSYDAVERLSPELMAEVRRRIASGRWEALGATEVESDTLLPCGEALARSFLVGQQGFRRLTGEPSRVLWLPDVFGYAGCLPQIMKETGVDYFFTTKLTWSKINPFPYSSFLWRGMDGSEVLVHVTQGNGYNQTVSPKELRTGSDAYRQSDVHHSFLAPTGYGDGGGGVDPEMCERARRFAKLAGVPKTRWGRVDAFFDDLQQAREQLPIYDGELYLEYHRGTFTTHGDLKAAFRSAERALQCWEAVRCARGESPLEEAVWKRLILAQFHDCIPGSSISEVYEKVVPELRQIASSSLEKAVQELGSEGKGGRCLFNPLPLRRIVIHREAGSGWKAYRLDPLSGAPLAELEPLQPLRNVEVDLHRLGSHRVEAGFDSRGCIESLQIDGTKIATTGALAELALYPDYPHDFEAWEIDRQALSLGKKENRCARASIENAGLLTATIAFARPLGKQSRVITRYRLDAFHPVLHIEWEIDWHEEQTLLKALWPTAYNGMNVRYGSPFGSVLRSQKAGSPRDEAMFEVPASRWAMVSDDGEQEGLSIMTEAKYGFSSRNGLLGLSLLRSPLITGEETHKRVMPAALRRKGKHRSIYADQGKHLLRVALSLHQPGRSREELAPALAEVLFTEAIAYEGAAYPSALRSLKGGESILPCWAKPKGPTSWILRLHETMGRRGTTELVMSPGWEAYEIDLAENILSRTPVTTVAFKPYQIRSLLFCRQ